MTRTPASEVGSDAEATSFRDAAAVARARSDPYNVARVFGVREAELPFAEFTTPSGGKAGGFPLPCAHRQDRKRSTASSKHAADTNRFYHASYLLTGIVTPGCVCAFPMLIETDAKPSGADK